MQCFSSVFIMLNMLKSFFIPSAFSSGVCLGFLGSRVWGLIIHVYFRNVKAADLQYPDTITTYDGCGCLSKPSAQTSLGNSPGFWGYFAVSPVSDMNCVQDLLLSWHPTCGRAPQLQPPEHRLCDRRRGTAEEFFLSLDSLLMC